jgi:flagellar basal-body rod protein FlgG
MNDILAIGLQGMQADMVRLEQTGMNLANVLTPGYKRAIPVEGPSFSTLIETNQQGGVPTDVPVQVHTDSHVGTLKATGQSLDVALAGQGFFEVMTSSGLAYTRSGAFRVDARGRLVTAQGDPVMGMSGEITLNTARPVIDGAGQIRSTDPAADPIAQLKIVSFDPNSAMPRLGAGLFGAGAGMKVLAESDAQVRQGFLENANVDPTTEMAGLARTMRHFESLQKVIQSYDDMLGTAIRKLGDGQ